MPQSQKVEIRNRTGLKISPRYGKAMLETLEGLEGIPMPAGGGSEAPERFRRAYIEQADVLGSTPAPGKGRGEARERSQILLDKLAERAAFERGGTRLYDALLIKFRAARQAAAGNGALPPSITEEQLVEIRNEEADHFELLTECIEELGADPTVETPGANVVGIETLGLIQVVSDPRTTFAQSLNAALAAELVDNASWELLVELAQELGHEEMAERFSIALEREEEHLERVRNWYTLLSMGAAGIEVDVDEMIAADEEEDEVDDEDDEEEDMDDYDDDEEEEDEEDDED